MAGRQTLDLSIGVRIPVPQFRQRRVQRLTVQKGSVRIELAEPWMIGYGESSEQDCD